jgi:hypothetical protein
LFNAKSEIKELAYDEGFALKPEYAWSGWFKFDGSPPGGWLLLARLSIFKNPEDV